MHSRDVGSVPRKDSIIFRARFSRISVGAATGQGGKGAALGGQTQRRGQLGYRGSYSVFPKEASTDRISKTLAPMWSRGSLFSPKLTLLTSATRGCMPTCDILQAVWRPAISQRNRKSMTRMFGLGPVFDATSRWQTCCHMSEGDVLTD